MSQPDDARVIIARLQLQRHPEGGWYRETWRAAAAAGERASGTAILYLLEQGERSHWHRVDAAELWHYHAGAPLRLRLSQDGMSVTDLRLGGDVLTDETPQALIPPGAWQAAEAIEGWTLVSCTVSPGFEFAGFELAPPGWEPNASPLPARQGGDQGVGAPHP